MLTPEQWTLLGFVSMIGAAGLKKLWVFGWTYADKVKDLADMKLDRDFWRDTALRSMGHTDAVLGVDTTQPAEPKGGR